MKRITLSLLLLAQLGQAQTPDREPLPGEWGYRPAEDLGVAVNPPAFSWVHEGAANGYTVQWADNAGFSRASSSGKLPWSVYTHHEPLRPGTWWWRYRITGKDGRESGWSRARKFVVPADAVVFPQPRMQDLRARIPERHPRLFLRPEELPKWKQWAAGGGRTAFQKLVSRADGLLKAQPTPEPAVKANSKDPKTRQYWWSNRVQTLKALEEAEILAFTWLMTGDEKYGEQARRFTMILAGWDPDGPTNFALNCEAAKPMLHRLARAYDWAWPLFSEEERGRIRAVLLRRAADAWKSGEARQGVGHLNQPYVSHANRTWHKLAENAIATYGETPEAEQFLHYAVTKFFAAYPVWSDDDGGWHEGLSYLSGYMGKAAWWMEIARTALGIDPFRKPFFANIGDYALYTAPPGTPDMGFGDLSSGPPSAGWSFLRYYARGNSNPYWTWWLDAWKIPEETGDPVLAFLFSASKAVPAKPPSDLPPSKIFGGTGIAVLNSNLLDGKENVQVRFKASPMGRSSHGHDPHNSFTLNAYGVPLLVNNVYRDIYGSPFHKDWTWTTRAQNAVLVDNQGQKPHSADLGGRILKSQFQEGLEYVAGDATASYEGRLTRARRHVIFVKPDVIILADELEAPQPSTYQWMLHGRSEFQVDQGGQRLVLDRGAAGVAVDYAADRPLALRQWTGYDPAPDKEYLESTGRPGIPPQWHVEAASTEPSARAFTLTVLRVFRKGERPGGEVKVSREGGVRRMEAATGKGLVSADFESKRAVVRRNGRAWTVVFPE